MPCLLPAGLRKCPPNPVVVTSQASNVAFRLCDKGNNTQVIAVYELCFDGSVSGAPQIFDLSGNPYTPVGVIGDCADGIDYEVICDQGQNPAVQVVALWDTSTVPPKLDYFTYSTTGVLTPYTPIGPLGSCSGTDIEDTSQCYIAIVNGTGYTAGDQIIQISFWDTSTTPPTLVSTVYRNQTTNSILTVAPPFADLTSCGGQSPETILLCDEITAPSGAVTVNQFLRQICVTCGAGAPKVTDYNLDGVTSYTVQGTVKQCASVVESTTECFTAHVAGTGYAIADRLIHYIQFDAQVTPATITSTLWYNETTNTTLVSAPNFADLRPCGLDVEPVSFCYTATVTNPNNAYNVGDQLRYTRFENVSEYSLAGPIYPIQVWFNVTQVRWIPTAQVNIPDLVPCLDGQIEVVCRCDDADGDGAGEISYKEIVSISPTGVVTVLANYNSGMTAPYTPISPVACSTPGDNLVRVRPGYKVLTGPEIFTLGADTTPPTVSVTFTVVTVGNAATPPTITTYAGTYPIFAGQSGSWSSVYSRDVSGLKPPLVITANAGDTIAVLWEDEQV